MFLNKVSFVYTFFGVSGRQKQTWGCQKEMYSNGVNKPVYYASFTQKCIMDKCWSMITNFECFLLAGVKMA